MMVLHLGQAARRYDDWAWLGGRGGYRNINSVPPNGLAGLGCPPQLGDVIDDVKGTLLGPLQAKADKLENALTVITVLSGVAALTGTLLLLRGR